MNFIASLIRAVMVSPALAAYGFAAVLGFILTGLGQFGEKLHKRAVKHGARLTDFIEGSTEQERKEFAARSCL